MKSNLKFKFFVLLTFCLAITGCSVFGSRKEETPKCEVLVKDQNFEIRKYSPYIIAATTVDGSFKEAQNSGFRILAGYIFGNNEKSAKISMTAPFVMRNDSASSEKYL